MRRKLALSKRWLVAGLVILASVALVLIALMWGEAWLNRIARSDYEKIKASYTVEPPPSRK